MVRRWKYYRQTDRRTMNNRQTEKLNWAFSSDELNFTARKPSLLNGCVCLVWFNMFLYHTSEKSLKGKEKKKRQTILAHSEFSGLFSHPTLHILAHVGGYKICDNGALFVSIHFWIPFLKTTWDEAWGYISLKRYLTNITMTKRLDKCVGLFLIHLYQPTKNIWFFCIHE